MRTSTNVCQRSAGARSKSCARGRVESSSGALNNIIVPERMALAQNLRGQHSCFCFLVVLMLPAVVAESVCNPEHALFVNNVLALCQETNPGAIPHLASESSIEYDFQVISPHAEPSQVSFARFASVATL